MYWAAEMAQHSLAAFAKDQHPHSDLQLSITPASWALGPPSGFYGLLHMYMVYLRTSGKTLINKRKSFQSAGLACWLHSRLVRDPVLKKVWLDQNYSIGHSCINPKYRIN